MKGGLGDKERLGHLLDAIQSIENFCREVDEPTFRGNYMLQLAVVKLLEIIGEASGKLSEELRKEYGHIEWPLIIGSRNILVHEYFAVNFDIVWEAVQNDLPKIESRNQKNIRTEVHLNPRIQTNEASFQCFSFVNNNDRSSFSKPIQRHRFFYRTK